MARIDGDAGTCTQFSGSGDRNDSVLHHAPFKYICPAGFEPALTGLQPAVLSPLHQGQMKCGRRELNPHIPNGTRAVCR